MLVVQGFGRGYCGLFRFRFYRLGEWWEVVVDDLLPTRHGRLIFVHSQQETEFWPALLEKAYAKFRGGSYAALEGGRGVEAAVEFTGGLPQVGSAGAGGVDDAGIVGEGGACDTGAGGVGSSGAGVGDACGAGACGAGAGGAGTGGVG